MADELKHSLLGGLTDVGSMPARDHLFRLELDGDTAILSPASNLSELELVHFDEEVREVSKRLDESTFRHILLDFEETDYYGSIALGFFLQLWKRVRSSEGSMAFCNVSAHELEVLKLTRLDELWTICSTREEALRSLRAERS